MRQRLERDIYNLVFIENGGLMSAGESPPPFSEAKKAGSDLYAFAAKVADRVLKSLRNPTDPVVAAMAAAVLADLDIRQEWQAGIDAAAQQ
jgi:hypothetical protein